ncbi:unnamed protein product [Orchesella dallaii]|uniref:Uncharacterized protein n=1 Tax=Orchesella dallaii TaxID=48710 RepID=A0ABP1R1K8_9HEXA
MDLNLLNTIEIFMHKLDLLMHASSQMSAKKKGKKSRKGIVEGAKGIVEGATEKVLGEKVAKVVKTAGDVLSWTAVVKGANLVESAITDAVMENGNETKVVKPASSTNRRDLFREILKTDEFIELVKEMVGHYYIAIKSDIQCYIPKLISNRLLMPFVDKEGNFGLALNALIKAKHESGSLTRLSPKLQKERDDDLQLKKDLEELIKKGTEIRNDYKPDEGVEDMSSHQQKDEEDDDEDDDDQDSAQSGEETDDDDPW